jgi:hypothetical protein
MIDMYSFGVLLLEMFTGSHEMMFLHTCLRESTLLRRCKGLSEVPNILAVWRVCCQVSPVLRPTANQALEMMSQNGM